MSNILWYPEPIKACVLTDVLNWKTSEKSYEDLCKRFGNGALQITSHQKLFNKFTREIQKMAEAQTNINEIMFNESMYLRYRILRDVISKVPIDNSYEKLRETMGDIGYQEFEFRYYRFYNGKRDLDYDRSKDPKPLGFSDLPIDVVETIVDKSDVKSRSNLRSVSRGLKNLVDSNLLKVGKITFLVEFWFISVFVDDIKTEFHCQDSGCNNASVGILTSKSCRHLSTFIGNPKLQLGILDINFNTSWPENMLVDNVFGSLAHTLNVGSLNLIGLTTQNLLEIILCVKPKILKKLEIESRDEVLRITQDLVKSEQWKQAEEVIILNSIICNIAHFFHFKRFDIFLKTVSMNSLLELRDGVSKSSNFEWCRLKILDRPNNGAVRKCLGLKKHVHNNMEYFVYNIPNSIESLVFSFFDIEIFIKKSNNSAGF